MFPWDILLGATLEAGLGLLAEAGFGDEVRALKERLTRRTEKERRAGFGRGDEQAAKASWVRRRYSPVLEHRRRPRRRSLLVCWGRAGAVSAATCWRP